MAIISRAAEQAPVYGAQERRRPSRGRFPEKCWRFAGRWITASSILPGGRHAPGERDLRQAIGGLTRRGEWASAAEGSLALAASLLKRGRPRDAKAVVDAARESCRKSPGDRMLIAAATLAGVALVDLGRLDEAETVLAAAQTVAAHADDRQALPPVALALARCRFWRGQYADARDALRLLLDRDLDDGLRVRADVMRARLAVADDDVASAISLGAAATERARVRSRRSDRRSSVRPRLRILAAGDLAALRGDVAACATASRASRDPLRQLRAQLLLCEHLRRSGARDDALRAFVPARRLPASALPRMLKCRRDIVADLLARDADAADVTTRHIAATGFHALALFVPKSGESRSAARLAVHAGGDAIEVLGLCQSAADEATTLGLVCEQVHRQVHATATGFFGVEPGGLARLAARGPDWRPGRSARHRRERVHRAAPGGRPRRGGDAGAVRREGDWRTWHPVGHRQHAGWRARGGGDVDGGGGGADCGGGPRRRAAVRRRRLQRTARHQRGHG